MYRLVAFALLMVSACTGGGSRSPDSKDSGPEGSAAEPDEPEAKTVDRSFEPALLKPASLTATAPDTYRVRFETTTGDFTVEVHRDWAPHGADRFYNLVSHGFYDGAGFFRAIEGFMVQFGIHGDPEVSRAWKGAEIPDDEVEQSNERGTISFATRGPDTRTTQVFINFGDNSKLDAMGFAPFGTVTEGMDVVDEIHTGYGEGAPRGMGPNQGTLERQGNAYLKRSFPKLDYVESAKIVK
jgi:peptidyl-prolyl cis-trans isomerase A (cyclophilin A)